MLVCLSSLLSVIAQYLTPLSIMVRERTFIAVKPDGVQRGLTGEIIKRFEAKGFKMVGMKFMQATEEHLKKHYADLADKPFYAGLCKYMSSGPLVAMCWEGTGVVKTARTMMGETRPADSKPGTIRGDFCIEVGRNIIHGSDSVESAQKEIALWFKPEELFSWTQANETWIYELMEFFGDVATTCGLNTLNQYLEHRSYIQGFSPSAADAEVFSSLAGAPGGLYCHALRWYNHIKSFSVQLNISLGNDLAEISIKPVKSTQEVKNKSNNLKSTQEDQKRVIDSQSASKAAKFSEDLPDLSEKFTVDDDDFDLFASDDEEEDKEAARVREERLRAYAEKKSKKPGPVAKSSVMLDVKPWDDETDLQATEAEIRKIKIEGLQWGASKLAPLAYGINKLCILCIVEDERVSVDDLVERICDLEDSVQSVDIAAFNKI
ncbi:hypothetical protein Pcinc_021592 [Petrolisthes cinctipes]|uniref:Nucleoside diphosphate kinase n=1 Tax=Petrolisthes cinctipes TaxID=88211 RepID=A0AAE1FGP8_PETCI|nr:hypothetical protein Pcinc_021592 [Petrolisthes cinctipes]